jgi:hypothetical protein
MRGRSMRCAGKIEDAIQVRSRGEEEAEEAMSKGANDQRCR